MLNREIFFKIIDVVFKRGKLGQSVFVNVFERVFGYIEHLDDFVEHLLYLFLSFLGKKNFVAVHFFCYSVKVFGMVAYPFDVV